MEFTTRKCQEVFEWGWLLLPAQVFTCREGKTWPEHCHTHTHTHLPETHSCMHKGAQTARVLTLLHQLSPQDTKISRTKEQGDHKDDWTRWKMYLCVCLCFRSLAHSQHFVLPLIQKKDPLFFNKPTILCLCFICGLQLPTKRQIYFLCLVAKKCIFRLHKVTFAKACKQNLVLPDFLFFFYLKDLKNMTLRPSGYVTVKTGEWHFMMGLAGNNHCFKAWQQLV